MIYAELTAVGPILLEARRPREFPGPSSPKAVKTKEREGSQQSRSNLIRTRRLKGTT